MRYILALSLLAVFFVSCWSDHRVALANVDPTGWGPGKAVSAVFENADTVSFYDMRLLVRCCENISADSIPLFLETVSPDSLVFAERLCIPATGAYKVLRRGFSEIEIPYRGNVLLGRKGSYNFIFTMLSDAAPIEGVTAVGVVFKPIDGKE